MKNKILIIGQAPPYQKQVYPYDTTLLYEMFNWVGISKKQSQQIFEFEALIDFFPGFDENGNHKKPDEKDILKYYNQVLKNKINQTNKIIVLGNEAKKYICPWLSHYGIDNKYLFLPHPSKRNYLLIINYKEEIIKLLNQFINNN